MNYEDSRGKRGDLILPQGTFVFIQDGASGQVHVAVGPYKESIGEIDKIVIFDEKSRKFIPSNDSNEAIQVARSADEGQYIVLINPAEPKEGEPRFPNRGKNSTTITLKTGSKVNIPGPATFPLWPGQIGKVLDGHNLKYNEYLIVRVYNEEQAKKNLANAIVKAASDVTTIGDSKDNKKTKKSLIAEEDLVTGKLLVIKGTDVSFYIPPTGIEVVSENGNYVRKAVTLERLEYCILLDQNGDKRYVKGPAVVFPKPTEEFLEQDGRKKFKALELNDNMGIYLKVIADYTENDREYKTGEELFITGKEQKIYFPREEHAIIKYDDRVMHYAVAITGGEARYVLNKETGEISLYVGPKMFIPDPRKEVIVKRVLDEKTVKLWFPDSPDAVQFNKQLEVEMSQSDMLGELGGRSNAYVTDRGFSKANKVYASSLNMADEMSRKNTFTKPRTLTMDNKYEGAVTINVWPGFAVQIVKKTGEREVVVGPKVRLLEFDETLEVLELSTGKPKSDNTLMKTVYLQTQNNIVSDIIDAETKDLVDVKIRLSYRVNFVGDNKKWFNVSNYVKLMTQHLRSVVRNKVKKITIEDFNNNAADILRDTILGSAEEGKKRPGKLFEENGMHVYDIEVLNIAIGDNEISFYLKDYQKHIVQKNLAINKLKKDLEDTKTEENIKRQMLEEGSKTDSVRAKISKEKLELANSMELIKVNAEKERQQVIDEVSKMVLEITKLNDEQKLNVEKEKSEIRTAEYEKQMTAIQPRLIEAMITIGGIKTSEILAKNIKEQGTPLTQLFQKGGMEGLLDPIKNTALYDNIMKAIEDYKELNTPKK
jgi:major vault protein